VKVFECSLKHILRVMLMRLLNSEIQNLFPVVSSWFARLACNKAFSAGLQQVGLQTVALVAEGSVASSTVSVDAGEVEKIFKECKWQQRKQRTLPL
jgi:hypothetical protein